MKCLSKILLAIALILLSPLNIVFAETSGFIMNGDTWTSFDYPNATYTIASNISDLGLIVGYYGDVNGTQHGFTKYGDTWTSFDYPNATATFAYDINDNGQIVGMYNDQGISGVAGSAWHGFLMDGNSFIQLNHPDADSTFGTYVNSINNSGQIVGSYVADIIVNENSTTYSHNAFLLDGNTYTSFEIPDAYTTHFTGISDAGLIVGYYASWDDGGIAHGFVKDGDDINLFGFPYSHPLDINDEGQMVGYNYGSCSYAGDGNTSASICYPDYSIGNKDFNITSTYASGINNSGQIVGYYNYNIHVPEPATMLLLGLGLMGLAGVRRKFRR